MMSRPGHRQWQCPLRLHDRFPNGLQNERSPQTELDSSAAAARLLAMQARRSAEDDALGAAKCVFAWWLEPEMPLRSAATLRRRLADVRADIALGLEALQRNIDGADRVASAC